uniref:Uncharacterized protein n=1 Tax=Glossina austeni TaxID=7395 RepID=A0A1A9UQM1_GLOAU
MFSDRCMQHNHHQHQHQHSSKSVLIAVHCKVIKYDENQNKTKSAKNNQAMVGKYKLFALDVVFISSLVPLLFVGQFKAQDKCRDYHMLIFPSIDHNRVGMLVHQL